MSRFIKGFIMNLKSVIKFVSKVDISDGTLEGVWRGDGFWVACAYVFFDDRSGTNGSPDTDTGGALELKFSLKLVLLLSYQLNLKMNK